MNEQYTTKFLNLGLFYDEAVLTFDGATCRNSVSLCLGKYFIHITWSIIGMKSIYGKKLYIN